MNRLIVLAGIFIGILASYSNSALAASSYANARNGVGLAVGSPGGITFFHKLDDSAMVQAFIGPGLLFGGDYALLFPKEIHAIPELTPYVGGGAFFFTHHDWYHHHRYHHDHHDSLGIAGRVPVGLLLQLSEAPVQFHFELAPSITVIPFMYTFIDAMIGARFTF